MTITLIDIAKRFMGIKEVPGEKDNPFIVWCLSLCGLPKDLLHDETAWCSAFLCGLCFLVGLPMGKANARSWLSIGTPIDIKDARPGFDIVVYQRGNDGVSGHVHLFAKQSGDIIYGVGGNQSNSVTVQGYKLKDVLGVRRLYQI